MDHAEALEQIDVAAAEPGGIERLTAGDTPVAAAVAGHLAACPACAGELVRIAGTAAAAAAVIRELPDPALRERTLAFVRELGRDRRAVRAAPDVGEQVSDAVDATTIPGPAGGVPGAVDAAAVAPARPVRRPWLLAGLAAAVVVAAVVGFAAGSAVRPAGAGPGGDAPDVAQVAGTMVRIAGRPDAVSVALAPVDGGSATGSVLYSPTSGELVMVATGLASAPTGSEYACWVETGGTRRRIGSMYVDGGTGTWAGAVDGLAGLPPGTVFGVSLVTGGGTGTPVLRGS